MTTQDKIVAQIGPILIRKGGYLIDLKDLPLYSSKDSLTEFLNVDASDENEVDKYCRQNAYIPQDISVGWVKAFQKEQEEAWVIAKKIEENMVSNADIDLIANKLSSMSLRCQTLTETELAKLNKNLCWLNKGTVLESNQQPKPDSLTKVPLMVKHYIFSQHPIWDNLLSIINQKRPLRQCKDTLSCRRFFFPHKRRPDQKYCTPECKDRARKRKH